jgi:hypothetical protein
MSENVVLVVDMCWFLLGMLVFFDRATMIATINDATKDTLAVEI